MPKRMINKISKILSKVGSVLLIFPFVSSSDMTQHSTVKVTFILWPHFFCKFEGWDRKCSVTLWRRSRNES